MELITIYSVREGPCNDVMEYITITERDKYFDLARELKKLWNMNVTIIPIVIGALGTIYQPLRSSRIWHKVNF